MFFQRKRKRKRGQSPPEDHKKRQTVVVSPFRQCQSKVAKLLKTFPTFAEDRLEAVSCHSWLVRNEQPDWIRNFREQKVFQCLESSRQRDLEELKTMRIQRNTKRFLSIEAVAFFMKHNRRMGLFDVGPMEAKMGALVEVWQQIVASPDASPEDKRIFQFFLDEWSKLEKFLTVCFNACKERHFQGMVIANVIDTFKRMNFLSLPYYHGTESPWSIVRLWNSLYRTSSAVAPDSFHLFSLFLDDNMETRRKFLMDVWTLLEKDHVPVLPRAKHDLLNVQWKNATTLVRSHAHDVHRVCLQDHVTLRILQLCERELKSQATAHNDIKRCVELLEPTMKTVFSHAKKEIVTWCEAVASGQPIGPQPDIKMTNALWPLLNSHVDATFISETRSLLCFFVRQHASFSDRLREIKLFHELDNISNVILLNRCISAQQTTALPDSWIEDFQTTLRTYVHNTILLPSYRAVVRQVGKRFESPQIGGRLREVQAASGVVAIVKPAIASILASVEKHLVEQLGLWNNAWRDAAQAIKSSEAQMRRDLDLNGSRIWHKVKQLAQWKQGWNTPRKMWDKTMEALGPEPSRLSVSGDVKVFDLSEDKQWGEIEEHWLQCAAHYAISEWDGRRSPNAESLISPHFGKLYHSPTLSDWNDWCESEASGRLSPILPHNDWQKNATQRLTAHPVSLLDIWCTLHGREFANAWLFGA